MSTKVLTSVRFSSLRGLRFFAVPFLLFPSAAALSQRINLPPVTRAKWENGARLVLMEYHKAPTLTVTVVFPGGSAADPADKAGVASLTTTLTKRGTEKRTAPQIAEQVDFLGGSLDGSVDDDRATVTLDVMAKDADAGLDLLADVLRHPTFPAEELERERQLGIAGLRAMADDPGEVARYVMDQTVYAGHPYGHAATITSLKAISRDDLLGYYHRFLVPNRMIIVAVGDFKAADMAAKLRARFGDWARGEDAAVDVPPVKPSPRKLLLIDKPDATQTQVRMVRTGFPRTSPDYFPAQVASAMLGGGFTSRLEDEIRVNRSLTYGIGSRFGTQKRGGDFDVSTFTKIETTRSLLDATSAVLKKTAAQGFTPAEIKKVQGYLAGLYAIRVQTPEALATQLADVAFYGLPDDYLATYLSRLKSVTLPQANRIARTYFAPNGLSLVLVAPAAKVNAQLKGIGAFETRPVDTVGK